MRAADTLIVMALVVVISLIATAGAETWSEWAACKADGAFNTGASAAAWAAGKTVSGVASAASLAADYSATAARKSVDVGKVVGATAVSVAQGTASQVVSTASRTASYTGDAVKGLASDVYETLPSKDRVEIAVHGGVAAAVFGGVASATAAVAAPFIAASAGVAVGATAISATATTATAASGLAGAAAAAAFSSTVEEARATGAKVGGAIGGALGSRDTVVEVAKSANKLIQGAVGAGGVTNIASQYKCEIRRLLSPHASSDHDCINAERHNFETDNHNDWAGRDWTHEMAKHGARVWDDARVHKRVTEGSKDYDAAHNLHVGFIHSVVNDVCGNDALGSDGCTGLDFGLLKAAATMPCNFKKKTRLMNQGMTEYLSLLRDNDEDAYWRELGGGCDGVGSDGRRIRFHADSDRCQEWKIERILTGKGGAVGRSAAGLLSLRRKVTEMEESLLCMQELIAPSILAAMNDKIAIVEAFLK